MRNYYIKVYNKVMEIRKVISQNLEKARGATSRKKLAEMSGVSYQTIYDIEEGNKSPSIEAIDKISRALGIAPFELLKDAPPTPRLYSLPVSQTIKKMLAIPDDIYDVAIEHEIAPKDWLLFKETVIASCKKKSNVSKKAILNG